MSARQFRAVASMRLALSKSGPYTDVILRSTRRGTIVKLNMARKPIKRAADSKVCDSVWKIEAASTACGTLLQAVTATVGLKKGVL
jgi:hypothetical protein